MKRPILLSTKVTMSGLATDTQVPANPSELFNLSGSPMWLDEVRFKINFQTVGGTPQVGMQHWCRVRLELGHTQLTNGFVPLCLFGPIFNRNASLPKLDTWNSTGTNQPAGSHIVWRLPKPLFVPAGAYVRPTFILSNQVPRVNGAAPIVIEIAYAGRQLEPHEKAPTVYDVPWVSSYIGSSYTAVGKYIESSTETNLVNPFEMPLSLQRFIYRQFFPQPAGAGAKTQSEASMAYLRDTTLQMVTSGGRIVVRDATPVGHIFHASTRSWDVNTVMDPKSFFLANFTMNYTDPAYVEVVYQNYLSLVGSRQVPAKQFE